VEFIRAWQQDRRQWTAFLGRLPTQLNLSVALKEIGIPETEYVATDLDEMRTLIAV
jgi:hypothetical protein